MNSYSLSTWTLLNLIIQFININTIMSHSLSIRALLHHEKVVNKLLLTVKLDKSGKTDWTVIGSLSVPLTRKQVFLFKNCSVDIGAIL